MTRALCIAVCGASGRMGRTVVRLCQEAEDLRLVGACTASGDPHIGEDAGTLAGARSAGVAVTDDMSAALLGADVAIDFSLPAALGELSRLAARQHVALVSGTTGVTDLSPLDEAATKIPVLWAPNMSLGIQVLSELVAEAARRLGPDFDIELTEVHHKLKVDAPSGTAVRLGDAIREVRPLQVTSGRQGIVGARRKDELGMFALRGGDVIGDHSVYFFGPGERLELTHRATNRDLFASGAIRAARWLAGKPARRYTLADVVRGA
jgi:4-hydroxy-tetrahydrodipicolinate reductase